MPHHLSLAIHPAPFKPSHLSIPPSPFSPRSPLTPAPTPQKQSRTTNLSTSTTSMPPAPNTPLQWVWTCHACTRAYPLGATRRCLDDGHHFCAGTTVVKSWRKDSSKRRVKRHRACGSEFDYLGWKGWGRWRRNSPGIASKSLVTDYKPTMEVGEKKDKNCWTQCDYPSQCRWGKRVGIHTPTPTKTEFDIPSIDTEVLKNTHVQDMPTLDDCFAASPPPPESECSAGALGRALRASAKRRKSLGTTSPTSPLSSSFSAQTAECFDVEMLDADDTAEATEMGCIDPALLAVTDTSYTSPSSVPPGKEKVEERAESTMDKIKNLLSSHKSHARRHITFPLVSSQQRKNRHSRYAVPIPTLQEPLVGVQGQTADSETVFDGFSPLERVKRWNENVVNVA